MGGKGRSRKFVEREPNGRAKRPTMEVLREMERKKLDEEMATVLAQPHRRGNHDRMAESALGRFVAAHGLKEVVYVAGGKYADLVAGWREAKGIPVEGRRSARGHGEGPTPEEVETWGKRIGAIRLSIATLTHGGLLAMNTLVLDDRDIPAAANFDAQIALGELAVIMGYLPRKEFH
jgi:hypothetical protein